MLPLVELLIVEFFRAFILTRMLIFVFLIFSMQMMLFSWGNGKNLMYFLLFMCFGVSSLLRV